MGLWKAGREVGILRVWSVLHLKALSSLSHGLSYFLEVQEQTFRGVFHSFRKIRTLSLDYKLYYEDVEPDLVCEDTEDLVGHGNYHSPSPRDKSSSLALGHCGGLLPLGLLWQKVLVTCLGSLFSCLSSDLGVKAPVQQLFLQLHARSPVLFEFRRRH